jgi:hypothetical protein
VRARIKESPVVEMRGAESVFDERVRTTGPPPRTSTASSYYALFSIDC